MATTSGTIQAERRVVIAMMDINDAKAVIKGLQEKPFICSENAIETNNGFVIKRIPQKYSKADKIRSMNDEELAEFLVDVETHGYYDQSVSGTLEMIDWLQSEAE